MRILLTNDDGINAEGMNALHVELEKEHDVVVIAPSGARSGSGHGITFVDPLRVDEVALGNGTVGYAIDGYPADCVKIGVRKLLADKPVELVVSGVNHGSNVGINVFYSGTVAAAAEACILGLPGIAVSLQRGGAMSFPEAARIGCKIIGRLIQHNSLPGSLTSINIPDRPVDQIAGIRMARQNLSRFGTEGYDKRIDPFGRPYYWIKGGVEVEADNADDDTRALRDGYICVTPLKLDMTDSARLKQLGDCGLHEIL